MKLNNKTVFVGVSGGVDSSLSARLLKEATPKNFKRLFGRPTPKGFRGYNVVGVFIRTWTPDFIECTWRAERRDAMRVCAHLDIPFLECDAEEAYKKGVADYMIEEYKKGRTPNPDVMCNREVKFGIFWNFAKEHGADFIATGHYAVNIGAVQPLAGPGGCTAKNIFQLSKSPDPSKDQSYFLWTLTQEDLAHILFPIGHLHKIEVRKLALKYKLPTATKKDSQGVCFLGPLDMKDFLKHYIKSEKGDVLLARQSLDDGGDENGKVIGIHDGAVFFTLGERHGFNITEKSEKDKPLYVIEKNINENTITVSPRQGLGEIDLYPASPLISGRRGRGLILINTNWILGVPEKDNGYTAQIRYHGELLNCTVEVLKDKKALINFDNNVLVDSGQSIVVYDGDICLGGGIVA